MQRGSRYRALHYATPKCWIASAKNKGILDCQTGQKEAPIKTIQEELDGLYEVLAPGSSVIKSNGHTPIVKETGKSQATIRNSDLAKFGPKSERQLDLKPYVERRPKTPTGKTTVEIIKRQAKDKKRKIEGDMKTKHRRVNDDTSCVSSIRSNVSRALRVRMPTKPKKIVVAAAPK